MAAIDPLARICPERISLPENNETKGTLCFHTYETLLILEKLVLAEISTAAAAADKTMAGERLVAIRSLGWGFQLSSNKEGISERIQEALKHGGQDEVIVHGHQVVSGIRICGSQSLWFIHNWWPTVFVFHSMGWLIWCYPQSKLQLSNVFYPPRPPQRFGPKIAITSLEFLRRLHRMIRSTRNWWVNFNPLQGSIWLVKIS